MHEYFMQHALSLAQKGRYTCAPNPMVGCVIVRDSHIIAQGWHEYAGGPHAEINALSQTNLDLRDATLYVTLEPCCHVGRTPPCINALLSAQIKKVVVACLDPNPLVAGRGIAALQSSGVDVVLGVCGAASQALNRYFFHYIQHRRPYVIAKWAMSLDGKIATETGNSRWITGQVARESVHDLRHAVDAILIGSNTARRDNPQLTVRYQDHQIPDREQPIRVILDGHQTLSKDLRILSGELPGETWLASDIMKKKKYSLTDLLQQLGSREITSLLVEGGAQTLQSFFRQYLVDEIHCYIAPMIIGGERAPTIFDGEGVDDIRDAFYFDWDSTHQYGEDVALIYRRKGINDV